MTTPSTNRLAEIPNTYPVELTAPEIARWAEGTDGVPFLHTLRADVPGPHVAVTAVVHGNEPCGAIALDALLEADVRPVRGALSFAFCNSEAYGRFDASDPNATRWVDEDFNRLWSASILESERGSAELRRARELRPWLDTVDLLLDIHSMQHPAPPLMMAGPVPKGVALARAVGTPSTIVVDEGHAAGPRMRDYADFADERSERNALLIECGQHWEAAAGPRALDAAVRFLRATGAVAPDYGEAWLLPLPEAQRVVRITERVTIETDDFSFSGDFTGMDVIAREGTVIAHDGDRPIRTPYDGCVLVMPSKRLWRGQTAVRLGRYED